MLFLSDYVNGRIIIIIKEINMSNIDTVTKTAYKEQIICNNYILQVFR